MFDLRSLFIFCLRFTILARANDPYYYDFSLDLKTLSLERVEILQRIVPNDQEIKLYKEYERNKKPVEVLSDEDKFMINVRGQLLPTHSIVNTIVLASPFLNTYPLNDAFIFENGHYIAESHCIGTSISMVHEDLNNLEVYCIVLHLINGDELYLGHRTVIYFVCFNYDFSTRCVITSIIR